MTAKKNMQLVALRGSRSQRQMAYEIGIPVSTYAMIETGHRFPRKALQKKLADHFHTTVDALFFDSVKPDASQAGGNVLNQRERKPQ